MPKTPRTATAAGPRSPGLPQARRNLRATHRTGLTLVRDMGSPGAVTLHLPATNDGAGLLAAGRFLAPPGGYFPALLEPVAVGGLVPAARTRIAAGARWVKLIGAFLYATCSDHHVGRVYVG